MSGRNNLTCQVKEIVWAALDLVQVPEDQTALRQAFGIREGVQAADQIQYTRDRLAAAA